MSRKTTLPVALIQERAVIDQGIGLADANLSISEARVAEAAKRSGTTPHGFMLTAIAECGAQNRVGFKAAGGVKSAREAAEYLAMATAHFGEEWLVAERFRFGASSLLGQLLATLTGKTPVAAGSGY